MIKILNALKTLWLWAARAIGSICLFLLLLVLVIGLTSDPSSLNTSLSTQVIREGNEHIVAVVHLSGPIVTATSSSDPLSLNTGVIDSRKTISLLRTLQAEAQVKAVVLRINSPGGAVVPSDEIALAVQQLNSLKPVIACMGDVAASGGYYIAAPSRKIIANPVTITGSIGVIAQFPKLSGLYDKLGIEMRTFKSGTFKDIGSMDRSMTAAEEQILQSIISDSYEQFIDVVARGRALDSATVRALADGRIYSGKQALEHDLIDQLGNIDDAILAAEQIAAISGAQVVEYNNQSLLSSLLETKLNFWPLAINPLVASQSQSGLYYLMSW